MTFFNSKYAFIVVPLFHTIILAGMTYAAYLTHS